MNQKKLFNHKDYNGVGVVRADSEMLLDILSNQTDDFLISLKKNIECFSRYKKPGAKNSLTHLQYVYRTLTNAEAFTSLFYTFKKAETGFLVFLFDRGGKVSWDELDNTLFSNELVQKLQSFGLVFVFPDYENPEYVVLPIEYRYLLIHNSKDRGSILYVLRNLGSEMVKQITFHVKMKFNTDIDPSFSKASNAAFLYYFLTTRGVEIKGALTAKQNEIISFVLQHGNDVNLRDLVKISPLSDDSDGNNIRDYDFSGTINSVFKNYFHRYHSHQTETSYTELQELFHMGVLMFSNPYNSNNVLIPKEIFPVLAQEYLVRIEETKKKVLAEMLSDVPKGMKSKSMDSLLHTLIKSITTFIVFSHIKPTQKGLIPKTAIKKCAKILKIDNVEHIDCLSIFILVKGYIANKGEKCFVLTQKGEKFLSDSFSALDFWRGIEDFFINTTDWNELYPAPNRVVENYPNSLNCDFKGLLNKCIRGLPRQWLRVAKIMKILYVDYDFIKIKTIHDKLNHNQREYYPGQPEPEYNDLDGMFMSILQTMHFLGLLDFIEGEKGISYIRLSETAIKLAANKPIKSQQKSAQTHKKFILQPNGEIVCMPGTPLEILSELGKFTEIKNIDHTITFELSSQSLVKGATEFKLDLSNIKKFLADHTKKELPQNITYLFKQLKAKEELLAVGRCGGYIIVKDHILLEEIKNIKPLKKHIAESCELPVLLLKPGSSIKEVLRELRKKGHLPKEAKDLDKEKPEFRHRYGDDDHYW